MEWLKIESKPTYSISDVGVVRNDKTGRILKPRVGTSGYEQIMLGRKTSPLYVHRLVAKAFLENKKQRPQVDHINGCKTDNRIENLRWVTVSENCYGFGYEQRVKGKYKPVVAHNAKLDKTIHFESRDATAKHFVCDKANIEYGKLYQKGNKKGWIFNLVEDIV